MKEFLCRDMEKIFVEDIIKNDGRLRAEAVYGYKAGSYFYMEEIGVYFWDNDIFREVTDTYKMVEVNITGERLIGKVIGDTKERDHYLAGEVLKDKYTNMFIFHDKIEKKSNFKGEEVCGLSLFDSILPLGDTASFIAESNNGFVFLVTSATLKEELYLMTFEGTKEPIHMI